MSTDQLPLARIGALMRASTDAVAREVHALGPLARVRPAPGEWCANEIVGHLLEADRRGFIGRVGAVLAADGVVFQPWDQPAVAAARHDAERDPEGLLAAWLGAREADLGLVATLPASALDRSGTHPAVGELTIGNLLHMERG